MPPIGHQHRLRTGRVSIPGGWYAITVCVEGRSPLLVTDPAHPVESGAVAARVVQALAFLRDAGRLVCHGYCVMPDHLHAVVELGPGRELSAEVHALKVFSGRAANRLLGTSGPFWQKGFHDHGLRKDEALAAVLRYVEENPVRKGYVDTPTAWPWSSAAPERGRIAPW